MINWIKLDYRPGTPPHPTPPYPTPPYPTPPHPTPPYPTPPYPTRPYPTLPHPTPPHPRYARVDLGFERAAAAARGGGGGVARGARVRRGERRGGGAPHRARPQRTRLAHEAQRALRRRRLCRCERRVFRPPTHFSHMSHPHFSHISHFNLVFFSFADPLISPICRTPLCPYLTF